MACIIVSTTDVKSSEQYEHSLDNKETYVRFSLDCNQEHLIPTIHEFSPAEVEASWYINDDFRRMKSNNRVLIRMLKSGRFEMENDDDICFRGIELEVLKEQRNQSLEKLRRALFNNQRRTSAEELAGILAELTDESGKAALSRAQRDTEALSTDLPKRPSQSPLRRTFPVSRPQSAIASF